jgi:acetamidase/formamidase
VSKASAVLSVCLLVLAPIALGGSQEGGSAGRKTHVLTPTPKTVVWGYFDPASKPALKIKSGETVEVRTLLAGTPETLQRGLLPPEEVEPALREIVTLVKDKGPGGHILTGPIFIEEAQPGDTLEVRIKDVKLVIPYGYTGFAGKRGFLPEDFDRTRTKIIRLDEKRMVGHFGRGIEIALRPFFGCMGVAPPPSAGRVSSGPPGVHAGNLDNKELVAGTTLFIPVHVAGALFAVGDGHAAQGNGEICITAIETSLRGTFQFLVRKDMKLRWPRAETPTHYIVMGLDRDLTKATKLAAREAIDFLVSNTDLSPDEAYMLASVAVDFAITQLVDGVVGVHGMIPKGIVKKKG